MKCSKCGKESRSRVVESRPHDGRVWRRRMCGICFNYFVTVERAGPKLKMPPETRSYYRSKKLTDRSVKPEEQSAASYTSGRSDGGAALAAYWFKRAEGKKS